jgi:aspartate carbamoyltransferase catalytic subunit
VINAGSGKDQHPTQALLDIYTLRRSFSHRGGIDGKQIVFAGDLLRGRTVRSLSTLLTKYQDVKQYFAAPPEFQIGQDILDFLDENGAEYVLTEDFEAAIKGADAIYMTRLQDEWDGADKTSARVDIERFSLRERHLQMLKADAVILHPLPRRLEIDVAIDSDPRAGYWRQVRNGMWARVALIAMTFKRNRHILDYYLTNL